MKRKTNVYGMSRSLKFEISTIYLEVLIRKGIYKVGFISTV